MKNYKQEYQDLLYVLDCFVGNLREEAKEESKFGNKECSRVGLLLTVSDELEDAVYEGYPRCTGCEEILKDEDKIFSFDNEEETYCKGCFENEVEDRLQEKHENPSLTDSQRNRLNRGV